jgi:hypothetical protein
MSTSLIRMLSRIANSGDPGEVARAEIERQQKAKREKSRRLAPRRKPGRDKKQASRKAHADETEALRVYAFEKWGGRCIACMGVLGSDWHLHHVIGGGLRRSRQSERNTVPLCPPCHRLAHRNDLGTLGALLTWALANGDAFARLTLTARIAKIHDSRRPTPGATHDR